MPRIATALGRAGLLPFCSAPLMIYLDPGRRELYATLISSYALAILCFLVGAWWGLALIRRSSATLAFSNIVVIAAFLGHALLDTPLFLILCAALYPTTVIVERRGRIFRAQPAYYARLRVQLTTVATASLLLATALLS